MKHSNLETESIVKSANQGDYAVPEFQRGFVWTVPQVLEFVDSLSRDFPVGSLLTWQSDTVIQRGDGRQERQKSWLIDGQQRTTALCTLFGRSPDWWDHNHSGTWTDHLAKFDIRLDVGTAELSFVARKSNSPQYVAVKDILATDNLFNLAQKLVDSGRTYTANVGEIAQRLAQVASLKKALLPVVEIDDNIELTDVAEIFKRLNSTGTQVKQADIYLGVVAARNPGWVNTNFLKFMHSLEDDGFEIEPAFLFRAFTGIGAEKSRFREVDPSFWNNIDSRKDWETTKRSLQSVCQGFREYGIINSDLVLSLNAMVAAAIYRAKFSQGSFGPFMAWMLCAIKRNLFSGTTETKLEEIIKITREAETQNAAMQGLYGMIGLNPDKDSPFDSDEFLETRSGRNSVQRLMIYLLAFKHNAQDWNTDGYHIRAAASGPYRPEWHHIFPRKWLKNNLPNLDSGSIDTVANMAVISGDANRKIAASEPKEYVRELNLAARGLLDEQAIPDPTFVGPQEYQQWLNNRAERLAQESNKYLAELRKET